MADHADADCGQQSEFTEALSERDRVVDRAAAGIQHDSRAAEFPTVRKILKILRAVRGDDADGADPASAARLTGHPVEFHRQLALLKDAAGVRPDTNKCDERK